MYQGKISVREELLGKRGGVPVHFQAECVRKVRSRNCFLRLTFTCCLALEPHARAPGVSGGGVSWASVGGRQL